MIERILQFSIQYRYLVVFLTSMIAFFGLLSLKKLPIDAVPDITNNQIQINTIVQGLTPEQIEKQVALPIENALKGIPGLESTRSLSRDGFSQTTAIFQDDLDVYFARQQVNERLAEVRSDLPPGAEPQMGPISTGLSEIYFWAVEYDLKHTVPPSHPGLHANGNYLTPEGKLLKTEKEKLGYLRVVQDWVIKPQLQSVKGLAGVDSIGGYILQYQVEPLLDRLQRLNISLIDLIQAIENNNVAVGSGFIEKNGEAFLVKADARIHSLTDLGEIVVAHKNERPIFLKDLANINLGEEARSGSSSKDGYEAVIGTAMMLIGENSRKVANDVDSKIKEVQSTLPESILISPLLNRMKLIDSTIATVATNLLEGALLVILILFVMLGNFRAALITAFVIPLAMLMTSVGMVHSSISGNLMSLGAIDFGLIVDGAIIIAENCLARLSLKRKELARTLTLDERLTEVMQASKEMIQPSVYGQAIIMLVYLPLLTLSGVEGKMFQPMAITVLFALASAFVLSLTFIPAMVALFVKDSHEEKESIALITAKQKYQAILEWSLNNPKLVIAISSFIVLASFLLFTQLGQEFAPTLDEQDIAVQATRSASTSLAEATKMQTNVEKTLLNFPEVEMVFSKTGTAELASDPMPADASDTFVILKNRNHWPNPKLEKMHLIEAMDERLSKLTGNSFEFTQPIQMRFNELIAGVKSDVAVKIYGDNLQIMESTAYKIAAVLKKIPGAHDVVVDRVTGAPELVFNVNRTASARFGVTIKEILELLQIAVNGVKAGVVYEGDRHFDIVVKLPAKDRENFSTLQTIPLFLSHGNFIPLKAVAEPVAKNGIGIINREQGKRMLSVEANVRGTDIGSFVAKAKQAVQTKVKIPPGYWVEWDGQFTHLHSAQERLAFIIPICLLSIIAILALAFHSLKDAFLIFTGVPLALSGGIIALTLRGLPFSLSAAVGFIALSGIAVLNGIVLITCIRQLANKGLKPNAAIMQGSIMRLRPVLLTALVASLGFVPMAFSSGAGAEVQKPLATVVIGGLISSTLLTLVVLPALTLIFSGESLKKIFNWQVSSSI